MLDQTKYLCNPNNLALSLREQTPRMQSRLTEHVSISRTKDAPARMPLQNTRVCPKIMVAITLSLRA